MLSLSLSLSLSVSLVNFKLFLTLPYIPSLSLYDTCLTIYCTCKVIIIIIVVLLDERCQTYLEQTKLFSKTFVLLLLFIIYFYYYSPITFVVSVTTIICKQRKNSQRMKKTRIKGNE